MRHEGYRENDYRFGDTYLAFIFTLAFPQVVLVAAPNKNIAPIYLLLLESGCHSVTVSLVKDINGSGSSVPAYLTNVNSILFFSANDGVYGEYLWKSDGTFGGTQMVKDINSRGDSYPSDLTNINGTLYFSADDGVNGKELWKAECR